MAQTSSLSQAGVAASAATSSSPQTLKPTTPQPGRRQRGHSTPSRTRSSAVEAATHALQQTLALVGGQKRPVGAEVPATSLATKAAGGEEGGGGLRLPVAPTAGQDKHTPTVNQALLEETQSAEAGQKPETNKLSTEENQESSREPTHETAKGKHPTSDRGRESSRRGGTTSRGSRVGVQFSDETPSSPPRPSPRDVGDVMQFFAEQEKSLQDSFLSLPKKSVKKQRSPSPKVSPAPGLEHLDNLIRLMEQLGSLKDENSRLRQRCHYLESTKLLLQARKDLSAYEAGETPSRFKTMPAKQQKQRHLHHRHHHHHHTKGEGGLDSRETSLLDVSGKPEAGDTSSAKRRSRISSAEELDYLDFVDSSSDQRPKRSKSGLHKRSFSTGSLEVPSELLLGDVSEVETRKRIKSKMGRSIFSSKSGAKSKSSKSGSKWARVKKVLTGQKIYEDLGTTIRTIRDLGKSSGSHGRHSTSGASISPADMSPPSSQVSSGDHRHTDSGVVMTSSAAQQESAQGSSPGGAAPSSRNPLVVVPLASRVEAEATSKSEHEGSDPDLTCDIWMGPPDWWEEYEARTEGSGRKGRGEEDEDGAEGGACGASTTNSEVSSVIEVTTMYLGSSKKDAPGASSSSQASPAATTSSGGLTVSMTASSISSSSANTRTGAVSPATPGEQQFLTVEKYPLQRRQSSPSLNGKEASEEGEDFLDDLAFMSEGPSRVLHKSSSCQSADLELPRTSDFSGDSRPHGSHKTKSYRTAWGRVKDIIHTRKDSAKRKTKKQRSGGTESEETSEIDIEGLYMEEQSSSSFGEGLLGRSTPKTASPVLRQQPKTVNTSSGADMAALLAGRMSDDFNKKMLEWEAKKNRKSAPIKVPAEESDLGSLDVSTASQEFPVRTVDLRDFKGKVPDTSSESTVAGESHTSLEVLGAHTSSPAHLEEIQRRMTDSFSRKMLEWEKLKYRSSLSSQREPSPEIERKGSKGRKDERQKSKRSREDKEKEKLEKMREREMQKVEREQLKLEKEKIRLEKERLRALEREAKLEKIKGRLCQTEQDSSFKNPVLGPLAEYKVTADFAHKLHQWELKKGLSHDVSNSIYLEAQKLNVQHLREETERQKPVQFSLATDETAGALTEEISGGGCMGEDDDDDFPDVDKEIEGDGDDETTTSVTEECLIKSNIDTLERANRQLIENLQQKEMEYADVQQQVTEVNRKLAKVKEEHAREMARFHRELALGSIAEPVKLEVGELESTMATMEEKIKAMENLGERLALSMESAAVGKWQSIDGEETVHTQLVELVNQMRNMLVQASHSAEESKKSMALSNFEKLYSHAMKLQIQMNNLRLSHLERNREIMTVKRQLLLQEVNNLLLQADITRRETELYQYQAAKKFASLRRWNTFSGSGRTRPAQAQMEITAKPQVELQPEGRSRQIDAPHVNIPYIPEDVIMASAASSSISAPASPSAVEAAGGTPISTVSGESPLHSQQQQTVMTTSSAASSSPQVPHLNPSSSLESGAQQQRQQQQRQQQQQLKLGYPGEPYHSSPAVASGSSTPHETKNVIASSTTASSENQSPHFLSVSPASPSYLRAISDPSQGIGQRQTQDSKKVKQQELSPTPSPTPISSALASSDNENLSSKQQLSLPASSQQISPSQPPHLEKHKVADAVPDAEADKQDPRSSIHQTQQQHHADNKKVSPSLATDTKKNDSVPLYYEIMELRKAKSIVEKGSPTLILSKEGRGPSSAPSPGKSLSLGESSSSSTISGTPAQIIPRQRSLDLAPSTPQEPRLARAASSIDDDYSPQPTVMKCTKTTTPVTQSVQLQSGVPLDSSDATSRLSPHSDNRRDLPRASDSSRTVTGKCPRSPVTKHNYLRRQKEDRDSAASSGKYLDYKAISPKGSPLPTRGKPPLPRQNTPIRQSPQTSPAAPDKGPRSKSVGEMTHGSERATGSSEDSNASKPLQDAINKFEKRQTMIETEDRPIELRKTPSPTLHLPRVGLVSRVRRLKPAAELLEESQKFKSGHSIYATRIMHRYLPKEGTKSLPPEASSLSQPTVCTALDGSSSNNKENNFVHTMVRRLSRETSPIKSAASSRTNSELSLKRTDSPRSNSEFVSSIVRKLSTGSGSSSPSSPKYKTNPFKDRTNEGQVKRMAQSFDEQPQSCSQDRTLSDSELGRRDQKTSPITHKKVQPSQQLASKPLSSKSCEEAMSQSSTSGTMQESSPLPSTSSQFQRQQQQHAASASPTTPHNHQSLPALSSEDATTRHRAATYCHSEQERRQVERQTQPARPASTSSAYDPHGHHLVPVEAGPSTEAKTKGARAGRSAASSLSPVRRGTGRGKMGTIRVLCKQSISFDLGVSLYTQKSEASGGGSPKSTRQVRSWDPSESAKAEAAAARSDIDVELTSHSSPGPSRAGASSGDRPVSSGSEGDAAHSSSHAEEKTKFRRFLDSSIKFFKVSK